MALSNILWFLAAFVVAGISADCMDTCVTKLAPLEKLAKEGKTAQLCQVVPDILKCFQDARPSCSDDNKKKIDEMKSGMAMYGSMCGAGGAGGSGGGAGAGGSGGNGAGASDACNFMPCVTGGSDQCKMYNCVMAELKKCGNDKAFDAFVKTAGDNYKEAKKKCANGSGTMTPSLVFVVASILLAISSRF